MSSRTGRFLKVSVAVIAAAMILASPAVQAEGLTRAACRAFEAALTDSYNTEAAQLRRVLQPQIALATQTFNALSAHERGKLRLLEQGFEVANLEAELVGRMRRSAAEFMRPVYQCMGHPELADEYAALLSLESEQWCMIDLEPEDDENGLTVALYRSIDVSASPEGVHIYSCVADHLSTTLREIFTDQDHRSRSGRICLNVHLSPTGPRLFPARDQEQGPPLTINAAIADVIGSRRDWVRERLDGCEEVLRPSDASASIEFTEGVSAERERFATGPSSPVGGETLTDAAI